MSQCNACPGDKEPSLCSIDCRWYDFTHTAEQRRVALRDAEEFDLAATVREALETVRRGVGRLHFDLLQRTLGKE